MSNDCDLPKACNACLSTKIAGPEISVYPDCFISEIQLNIFPPSVTYTASKAATTSSSTSSSSSQPPQGKNQSHKFSTSNHSNSKDNNTMTAAATMATTSLSGHYLSIDVHENNKLQSFMPNDVSCEPDGRESSSGGGVEKPVGIFSHISFKRSDSILHISIGNSSKIVKRNKRKRKWFFAKLCKFSRKTKRNESNREMYVSPQACNSHDNNKGVYHLNNTQGLNIANDSLIITINSKSHGANATADNDTHVNSFRILEGDLVCGANELDFYMNEIKKRENRG